MVTGSFHSSLFWSKFGKNSPTAFLGCLYFYDFPPKSTASLSWLCAGDTALAIPSTNTLDDRQQGRQEPEFESSNVYSSHWDFDLMDLSHLNKLPKLLFPLNFSLCLCSKKV